MPMRQPGVFVSTVEAVIEAATRAPSPDLTSTALDVPSWAHDDDRRFV